MNETRTVELALLTRCLIVITFAVYEFGGGYTDNGKPKGEPGPWQGITQLMEDLEEAVKQPATSAKPGAGG
jgi:hypothetical protein